MWFVISYLNYKQWRQLNPQELEDWCALGHYAYGKFQVQGIDQAKLHMAPLPLVYLFLIFTIYFLLFGWWIRGIASHIVSMLEVDFEF